MTFAVSINLKISNLNFCNHVLTFKTIFTLVGWRGFKSLHTILSLLPITMRKTSTYSHVQPLNVTSQRQTAQTNPRDGIAAPDALLQPHYIMNFWHDIFSKSRSTFRTKTGLISVNEFFCGSKFTLLFLTIGFP